MSNSKFSDYFLKMLGFNEEESKLILNLKKEYNKKPILTKDSEIMKTNRYSGLSNADKASAERFNNEFGNIANPAPERALRKYMR